jgi:pyruvate formate lyase activating enzyme
MLSTRRKRRRKIQRLPIARYQKLSLIDYPGRICGKVVVSGCNFRCPYCHKTELIFNPNKLSNIEERDVLNHLYRVKRYLKGLVIGGGEPTLHNGLVSFAYKVKSLGYPLKIDTNGTNPNRLKKLVEEELVDYISLDVKAPMDRYQEVVRYRVDVQKIMESIRVLRRGAVDYEFSVTAVPGLVDGKEIEKIAQILVGSKRFVIKSFTPGNTLCSKYSDLNPFSKEELIVIRDNVASYFADCRVQ